MIEVGDYIKDKEGNITRIFNLLNLDREVYLYLGEDGYQYSDNAIKSHSKNIIDLIEIGDYINGKLIEEIANIQGKTCLFYDLELPMEIGLHFYTEQDIKTIVTHEQFENIEYKAETEDK